MNDVLHQHQEEDGKLKEKKMKTTKLINLRNDLMLTFVFPFLYGMLVSFCLIIGWVTAMMLGLKLREQLFIEGIIRFAMIAFAGMLLANLLSPLYTNFLAASPTPVLLVCGSLFYKNKTILE